MKRRLLAIIAFFALWPGLAYAQSSSPEEQREAIQRMEEQTLERLYRERPETRNEIQNAVGYAVFSSGELAVIWVSAGFGHGVAHNNIGGQDIYMQMAKAGIGLGLGAKDFNTVFVFNDADTFHKFTTVGLDLSGTADIAVKSGPQGDAVSGAGDILPGTRIYQMTDTGLIAQAMIQGMKFWRDDSLNQVLASSSGDYDYREKPYNNPSYRYNR